MKIDVWLILVGAVAGYILAWYVNEPRTDYVCWLPNVTPDVVTVDARELRRDAPMVFVQSGQRTLWVHRNQINVCEEETK